MVVDYRDDSPFTEELHTIPEIADALRHKKYGVDVREAIAQAVEKLGQTGNVIYASGNPAGTFATEEALKAAYPNGQDGIFVVIENGLWYTWNPRTDAWEAGGPYQAPMSTTEVEDGRVWADGTTTSSKIGDAIRGQFKRVKSELDRIDYVDKEQDSQINQVKDDLEQVEKKDEELDSRIKYHETALELKEVRLRDDSGNLVWDGNSFLTGEVVLPKTDKTGLEEGIPVDSSIIGYTFLARYREFGLPILKFESAELPALTKGDGKLRGVRFEYDPNLTNYGQKFSGVLDTIKVKGNTSATFPKKSYNIKFDSNVQINSNWGKHKKYTLNADWVDFSHIRNELGADLWRLIKADRISHNHDSLVDSQGSFISDEDGNVITGETRQQFAMGMNLGAINDFPVLVVVNGIYHGLYSFQIPKDDWMAGMGHEKSGEAILSANNTLVGAGFNGEIQTDDDGNLDAIDFEVEYVSDEDDQAWIAPKLNQIVQMLQNGEDPTQLVDYESLIDYVVHNLLIAGTDNVIHNYLLDTWNHGNTWFFVPYDMDATFGNRWDGKNVQTAAHFTLGRMNDNALFKWAIESKADDIKNRWNQLRLNILSDYNLNALIMNKALPVSQAVLDYERLRWSSIPNTRGNTIEQVWNWISMRLRYLDEQINNL